MPDVSKTYDAVIIGGGPAGLTAAIYLGRARYRVLVIEKDSFGGQINLTSEVVNYPGVFATSGRELGETMRRQAEAFGAEFMIAEVTGLDMSGDVKKVKTSKGDIECLSVLLATGASPRKGGFEGEDEYRGHGVAYCATCDGEFFTDMDVFVIGGGFAAAEEAVFLTKYAKHVTILVRKDSFSCAPASSEEARNHPKIDVRYNTKLIKAEGDKALRSAMLENTKTGEIENWKPQDSDSFGIFVFVGYEPATKLVEGIADIDERGYIITDDHQMTTCPGLYAAGDVCQKPLRQVTTAVGQAATCAVEMERYIKDAQEKTGIVPQGPVTRVDKNVEPDKKDEKAAASGTLFTPDIVNQLNAVFERMANPLKLVVTMDDRPVSAELKAYCEELAKLTDKVTVEIGAEPSEGDLPKVQVCKADGSWTGLAFHGVPGGHEFTSFVLGLYNASGPGQPISDEDRAGIEAIDKPTHMQVLVSLSCTMCPDLVVAAQHIAADNDNVTSEVYDISHFPELRDRYDVMSVPCLVINGGTPDEKVSFGKKNIAELLELL